jgi:hypothetical protein
MKRSARRSIVSVRWTSFPKKRLIRSCPPMMPPLISRRCERLEAGLCSGPTSSPVGPSSERSSTTRSN